MEYLEFYAKVLGDNSINPKINTVIYSDGGDVDVDGPGRLEAQASVDTLNMIPESKDCLMFLIEINRKTILFYFFD